jgi:hypothetical protein
MYCLYRYYFQFTASRTRFSFAAPSGDGSPIPVTFLILPNFDLALFVNFKIESAQVLASAHLQIFQVVPNLFRDTKSKENLLRQTLNRFSLKRFLN